MSDTCSLPLHELHYSLYYVTECYYERGSKEKKLEEPTYCRLLVNPWLKELQHRSLLLGWVCKYVEIAP